MRNYLKKINYKKLIFDIIFILLGTLLMSVGFQLFLEPNNIVPGGFMGLAQIIYKLLMQIGFTGISISVWYLILNSVLFIFSIKVLGFDFGFRAGIGIVSYSLFIDLLSKSTFISNTIEKIANESLLVGDSAFILYAIYGGLLMGTGMGLVFRANGSTGGCDMLALVIKKFFPTITSGQLVIIVDAIVIILSSIAYQSIILPLYALITIFIAGKVSDIFVDGVKSVRAYYILTSKKEELSEKIMTSLNRGVTNIKCEGMYTHQEKDMLLVMITKNQVLPLKALIKEIDPDAFMFCSNIKEAYGIGFIPLNNKKPEVKEEKDS